MAWVKACPYRTPAQAVRVTLLRAAVCVGWAAVAGAPATACNLTGLWVYTPEPGYVYRWAEAADGAMACFAGADFWHAASGRVSPGSGGSSEVTLVFADPKCPGANRAMPPITKHGLLGPQCDEVVMNDTQPNCPAHGLCTYKRVPPPPPPPPPCPSNATASLDLQWLECRATRISAGCREPIQPGSANPTNRGVNATYAFTPDATHSYGAQWTRDFAYMVASAADLMDENDVKRSVRYTYAGQRADGCMPDRVQIDGLSVMGPGAAGHGFADHAIDNGPFAALLLTAAATAWGPDEKLFCELEPQAKRALSFVQRSSNGLVFNDPDRPNCTYGFTDTVAKTGNLLFCSLLYVDASHQLSSLASRFGCGNATAYATEAARTAAAIDELKDPSGPLWFAATIDNQLPDVWGTAYLVALNLSTKANRQAAMDAMVAQPDLYFEAGQVRSLPYPIGWTRCFGGRCPGEGSYQNGGYWATPLHYMAAALKATGHGDFATSLLATAVADFKAHGIYEDVDYGHPSQTHGVLNYTDSVTNALAAVRILLQ